MKLKEIFEKANVNIPDFPSILLEEEFENCTPLKSIQEEDKIIILFEEDDIQMMINLLNDDEYFVITESCDCLPFGSFEAFNKKGALYVSS